MGKKLLSKLAGIVILTTSLPLVSMVGCDNEFKVDFQEKKLTGQQKSFTFEGKSGIAPKKGISVEIVGQEAYLTYLSLESPTVYVDHKKVNIQINIDENFDANFTFNFNLRLTNNDTNEAITIEGFSIIFQNTPIQKDVVKIVEKSIGGTGQYTFTYKFIFSNMPKESGRVGVSLEGVSSNIITPEQEDFRVEREGELFVLYVKLNVNVKIVTPFIEDFILWLDFKNSYDVAQEESADCVIRFNFDENQNFIPPDYFSIEHGVLTGVKNGVEKAQISKYNTLKIPDGVTSINGNVFNGSSPFDYSNITTIIFPNTIKQLPLNCFAGLSSLFYIDITSYTRWPEWFSSQNESKSVFSTTPHQSFKYNGGIVWVNSSITNKEAVGSSYVLPTFGYYYLEHLWTVCHKDDIVPDSFYEIEKDTSTGDVILKSVKKDMVSHLGEYQVIHIPDEVNVIKEDALKSFSKTVYRNEDKQTQFRRFIPSANLKRIEGNALKHLCIAGYILFECPLLEEIGQKAFASAKWYVAGVSEAACPVIEADAGVFFKDCIKFNIFNDYCFYFGGTYQSYRGWNNICPLTIPKSTTNIGKCLFGGEEHEQTNGAYYDLVFESCPQLNIDELAFAYNSGLRSIDLSAVNYQDFLNWIPTTTTTSSSVFYNSGTTDEDHIVYFNPNAEELTDEQMQQMITKLTSSDDGWGLDATHWRFQRKN